MREITKENFDANTSAITVKQGNDIEAYECFPSIPAFKGWGISGVNNRLTVNGKATLTPEEEKIIQQWMDEA